MPGTFQVGRTGERSASWWLHAEDGGIPAWAGGTFPDVPRAADACRQFRERARDWRYEVLEFRPHRYRWQALDETGEVVARSMFSYDDRHRAEVACRAARELVVTAEPGWG